MKLFFGFKQFSMNFDVSNSKIDYILKFSENNQVNSISIQKKKKHRFVQQLKILDYNKKENQTSKKKQIKKNDKKIERKIELRKKNLVQRMSKT